MGEFGRRDVLAVVPDGVTAPKGAQAPPMTRHDPPVVGYAGHLYPWKGVNVLIEALACVPAARGIVVGGMPGEADLPRMRGLARELNVGDRVTCTGAVAPPEVARLIEEADVLVLPNTATHISAR